MNTTFFRIDLMRQLRDYGNLIFVLIMPTTMYIIFGATQSFGDDPAGNANVSFYIMASMAAYGGALSAASIAGTAAIEQMQGWGRQLGLTPASGRRIVATKVAVALTITALAITFVFVTGALTGARADSPSVWVFTFLLILGGSSIFALLGYAIAVTFKSDSATGIASGAIVLLSFLGNVFTPLSGTMLTIAKFTPLYGYVSLARWPQLEGVVLNEGSDELWLILANITVWIALFAALAVLGTRRGRQRR
ncbi:ABC transporter permease [Jonesia quinghaiensis]|uniref:ABC transporter permease n=1 Tax=Jonesia quinghaiensis TaxID=262806 RepID=UPI0003F67410|nr:ABC transporter [Jonesia quinghaiensis]